IRSHIYKDTLQILAFWAIWAGIFSSINLWAGPLWSDPQWLKLLHYQKNWIGKYVSQADGKDFFLSANGKYSPQDELEALLYHLEHDEIDKLDEDKNVFCRFPSRVRWLKKMGYA